MYDQIKSSAHFATFTWHASHPVLLSLNKVASRLESLLWILSGGETLSASILAPISLDVSHGFPWAFLSLCLQELPAAAVGAAVDGGDWAGAAAELELALTGPVGGVLAAGWMSVASARFSSHRAIVDWEAGCGAANRLMPLKRLDLPTQLWQQPLS